MRVIVCGVPGVGKSTVMSIVAEKSNHPIVNFGTIMFEEAKEKNLVSHRDDMRKLPMEVQRELQRSAALKIGNMKDALIDTHLTIKTPYGYFPGLPYHVLLEIKPHLIVVIEAEPEDVCRRRGKDEDRKRDYDDINIIREHQKINRYYAAAASTISGANLIFVRNEEGRAEYAAEEILRAMERKG